MIALRALRYARGMTQRQVADAIGVSATSITQYESGDREPSIDKLKKLAALFDCTIDELVNGKTKKKVIVRRRKNKCMK
ncbi:MAG: helix-turn-helix transcriptional regulator [Oscillospiraceae bacterium]|nr:helix-turn-helix transcriptional regulator [Oscillospiraceae bacterium]